MLSASLNKTFPSFLPSFLHHFYHAVIAIKISNLFICFCSFDLSCPILEKDIFIVNSNIVLSCLIKIVFVFNLVSFDLL